MKKILKWALIALGVIIVLSALARSCSSDDTTTSGEQTSTQQNEQADSNDKIEETEEAIETPEEQTSEQIGEGDVGDHHIVIGDVTLDKDYAERPAAIVTFTWTNNSDEAARFLGTISDKCFQDGVQCDSATIVGLNSGTDSMKEIKPGASLELKQAYKIDPSKPFDIELEELIAFADTGKVIKTFDAFEGASESTTEATTEMETERDFSKSFGIGFDEFQQGFRSAAKAQDSGFRVGDIKIDGETGVAEISPSLGLVIGFNEDNEINGVIFIGQGDGTDDSGANIVNAMILTIQAISPDMTKEDAAQILIDAEIADDGAGKTISDGIEYSFGTSDAIGATMTIQYVE